MTVGWPSNGRRASSISALPAPAAQTSAGGTACSLLPAVGCAAAQASPPHRTPISSLAIPLLTHTCCYSPATVDEPVNPRTVVLPSAWETTASLPCLCVVPFLGLAVVHRLGALGAAWSTWSTTFHRKSTVRGEADSWVHGHNPVFFICQVSHFVRPVGLQIFQDEESFHSAGRENGPSVMRNRLYIFKTHQTGN